MMNKKSRCFVFALLVGCFGAPDILFATEPCPPSPCFDSEMKLDAAQCKQRADWIAIGLIDEVKHDRQGFPLNKDFASFIFKVISVEKGKPPADRLRFTVGWCENPQELPSQISGTFRFYGSNHSILSTAGAQYFAFEPVSGSGTSSNLAPFEERPFHH